MSGSFSDSFANTFHIGKVQRKPLRNEISTLRSRAAKLTKSKDQQDVMAGLEEARKVIDKKAKTNADRQTSVQITENMLSTLRPKIADLESKAPKRTDITVKTKAPTKEDLARAKALEQEVAKVKKDIDTQFAGTPDKPSVDMQTAPETADYSRMALQGQADRIGLTIKGSIVDTTVDATIRGEIAELRERMKEAAEFADEARAHVAEYGKIIDEGRGLLTQLGKKMGGKAVQTPLSVKMEKLNAVLHPEGGLLNPSGMRAAAQDLQNEIDGITDLDAYAGTTGQQVDQKTNGAAAQAIFDKKLIDTKLEELRLLAEPLDSPAYRTLLSRTLDTRVRIGKLEPNYLDPVALADAILRDIAVERTALEQQLAGLYDQVNTKLGAVQTKISLLETTKTVPALALDKKQLPVFQADWKEITAMMGSITQMMPAKAADALVGQGMANLTSVKPLIETVEKLVDALAKKNDPNEAETVTGVDTRLDALKQAWKDAGGSGKPLPKYYKDDFKKLGDEYDKLMKALPTAKAKAIADGVKKFEDALNPKLTLANELDDFIENTVRPDMQGKYLMYNLAAMNGGIGSPNAIGNALDALSAELEKLPPDKAKLTTLMGAVDTLFQGIDSAQALIDAANSTHAEEKQKKADKKAAEKQTKAPLRDRLRGLKDQFDDASREVKDAKGDTNLLKQIERMLDQAEVEVEAAKEKEATRSMDRIQDHIDLVLANPKGEVARRRKELPDLYNNWRKIRDTAAGNLDTVKATVLSYQPDEATRKKVEKLGRRMDAYRKMFAKGHGQLRHLIGTLSDDTQPDQARRDAREQALGAVADLQRGLQSHPLSALLAKSPIPAARAVPGRLLAGLDRLYFTILTCVE